MKILKISIFLILIVVFKSSAQSPPPPPPLSDNQEEIPVADNVGFLILVGGIYFIQRTWKKTK
jgi:hypothetical protein